MSSDRGYNGWRNYETWAVALWLDNDEGSYRYWREVAQVVWEDSQESEERSVTGGPLFSRTEVTVQALAERLKGEVEDANPLADGGTLYSDLLTAALSEVDWREVAQNWLADIATDVPSAETP
jgi:uncharacterized protein (DUF433 family)